MKQISVEKVVLNMGCGSKTKIEDAVSILSQVSGMKPLETYSRKRSTFNFPKGKAIGCKVTVRKDAGELVRKLLAAKENVLRKGSFDSTGNVSFGVGEYIDVPGMEYNPKIGMLGFDVCITLKRPGYRVKRKRNSLKIGKRHLIAKEDAMKFMQDNFSVRLV